ncbi:MAG: hypothetical protein E7425_00080 [Ruminococcaceae bacterium]|nr:hypothetical protein [Oscillospiraceae bacterium]
MSIFKKTPAPAGYEKGRMYDYSTAEGRIATAEWLFQQARDERAVREAEWRRYNDYYNFAHDAAREMAEALEDSGLPWTPACVPDPYIMVESQIDPELPQPEFHGRDDDLDSVKAHERELAVRYIVEENRLSDLNTSNERRLRKLGDAFWKAYWDETMPCGERSGNIRVRDVAPQNFYPDPTAEDLQSCEYVFYVYTMHKLRFWRLYHDELRRQGVALDDIVSGTGYREMDDALDPGAQSAAARDDLVQIMEFWYRQPFDIKDARAGAIGCSIQAGGVELRHIPNYWEKTGRQCELFPFVHYWCIRDETQFWNRSELEPILPLVDAADRELATGLFNDAMTANDIIIMEDGALAPGEELTNVPGAVVKVNQGRGGGIARLGGLGDGGKSLHMVEWLLGQIQRANRNYDSNNGRETARVTTASGLLQLRSDAQAQTQIKTADRNAGFCRLYELLDALALEFFDDDRLLFIGAKQSGKEGESVLYNSDRYARATPELSDPLTGETVREKQVYYPRVDVTVTCGDAMAKTPGATVELLDKLAATQVTADNWQLLAAMLDYMDVPQKHEIARAWREKFAPAQAAEQTQQSSIRGGDGVTGPVVPAWR